MAAKNTHQLERSATHLIHRAGQCATDIFQVEARSSGLTPRQFAVLMTIAEEEGLTQTDLVDRTGIDRSTLADIVECHHRQPWIENRYRPSQCEKLDGHTLRLLGRADRLSRKSRRYRLP